LEEKRNKPFSWLPTVLIILLAIMLASSLFGNTNSAKEIKRYELMEQVEANNVLEVSTHGSVLYGIYVTHPDKDATKVTVEEFEEKGKYDFYVTCASTNAAGTLADNLESKGVKVCDTDPPSESFLSQIIPYVYILLIIGIAIFTFKMLSRMNGKNMDFGKNKARVESNLKVRFDDVAGCDEEKNEMQEIVEFLKNPKKFTDLGARIPKGVLLVGPPGTGKTLLAKAIAGEAGVPFFSITGSDFVEMFVGVGAARVRDLFETAKKNMPCLIFIDEIDAVGRHRGTGIGNTNDEREQTLNQLLVQMDGFESSDGIVVIAATNRPDVLDPALLRAGRFDRQIVVNVPDVRGREKILRLYAKGKPFSDKINFASIARVLSGATGADIENILNEAAILAARDNRAIITQSDIMEGISKVTIGPQKRSAVVSEMDKRNTAYHEAGHAIVAKSCEHLKDEVQEVSIIPRGRAGGYTAHSPTEDYMQYTREQLIEYLRIDMGGRAAEIIKNGNIGTGASSDIKHATNLARSMVTEYGMSDVLGPVYYAGEGEMFLGKDMQSKNNVSAKTAELIDSEVKKLLDQALSDAIAILREKEKVMDNMATVLLQKETIYSQDVDDLLAGKSARVVIKKIDVRDQEHEAEDRLAREAKQKRDEELQAQSKIDQEIWRNSAMMAYNGQTMDHTANQPKNTDTPTQESAKDEPLITTPETPKDTDTDKDNK